MSTTPDAASRAVARAVSDALRAAGVSQRDAAERSGIPLTTLSRRLTGASPLLYTELVALAGLAGVTVTELAAEVERVAS